MPLTVTALYAGLIGCLLLVLAARVILLRRSAKVGWGDGGNRVLNRRIRAFGNCTEYAPFGLLLLALIELNGAPDWTLHSIGLLLISGRALHGWSFSFTDGHMGARVGGMGLTLAALGLASLTALTQAL